MKEANRETQTFFIYRSSAGSGKTYRLAVEYISLALRNPNIFDKILAVTFTNKATKEMKERILAFLQLLADKKDGGLSELMQRLTDLSEDQVAENAKLVISKILHRYTHFSVNTIDAFFQKVVKSFAKELGLLGNYKVELDREKIRKELIDRIIDELGKDAELTEWLIEFSFSKVDESKSRDIRPQIESLANEIFKESFRPAEKVLEKVTSRDFKKFRSEIGAELSTFENTMRSKAREALDLLEKRGLSADDFAFKASGPAGYFSRVINTIDFKPKDRVKAALADPEKWFAKSSDKKQEIMRAVEGGLQAITAFMAEYFERRHPDYVTAKAVLQNFYVFGILSHIIQKLRAYRYENDVLLISDVPVFLKGIIGENEAPFIYEKTGSWYRHFLIDEFQDTSEFQWQNFRPLVENGLSQGNTSMLVGDGKQSVYRWRGGDWNLILNRVKQDLRLWNPVEKKLSLNWRSSAHIVRFNNEVFSFLPSLISGKLNSLIEEAPVTREAKDRLTSMAGDAEKLYNEVTQEVAAKNLKHPDGAIEIYAYQKDREFPWKEAALKALPEMTERLQEAGFQAKDIAVLVRKSDEGKRVIEHLIRYKNSERAKKRYCYDAVSNESLFIGNASAIRLLINCIKYAANPDDKIAYGEIAFYYRKMSALPGQDTSSDDLQFICEEDGVPPKFLAEINQLIRRPVYEITEQLIRLFELTDCGHKGYLQAFQDMVLEYFADESKDINDFLIWWEEKGKRRSVQMPDDINAIRVMTIHKSKGLEFKAVLVPFCDWSLDHESTKDNILWCRPDRKPYNAVSVLPVKYSSQLKESHFADEYFEEMIKAHIDNLNLLYVALTRAENFLAVNCPPPASDVKYAGDLLIRAVESMQLSPANELPKMVIEEVDHAKKFSVGQLKTEGRQPELWKSEDTGSEYRSTDWTGKIAIRKNSNIFLGPEGEEKKSKIDYGLLLHEILAKINNEKEAEIQIEKFYREGRLSDEDKQKLREQLRGIFSLAQVRDWFNTDWEVRVEAAVMSADGRAGRPDRVLLKDRHAVVIDFKTGTEKSADLRQVKNYMLLLEQMGYRPAEGYLLYLATNDIVKVP